MKKYCMVFEIKKDCVEKYVEIHKKAWPEQVRAVREAGAGECIMYIYGNTSILYCKCDDIDKWFNNLLNDETYKKWQKVVGPWMVQKDDESNSPELLEKIFDLEQQLTGPLQQV